MLGFLYVISSEVRTLASDPSDLLVKSVGAALRRLRETDGMKQDEFSARLQSVGLAQPGLTHRHGVTSVGYQIGRRAAGFGSGASSHTHQRHARPVRPMTARSISVSVYSMQRGHRLM